MTESDGLVVLLTSRSQHVSLSHLESSEVTKGTIVLFNPSAFSAIERLPLPLSARICLEISQHLLQKYASSQVLPIVTVKRHSQQKGNKNIKQKEFLHFLAFLK